MIADCRPAPAAPCCGFYQAWRTLSHHRHHAIECIPPLPWLASLAVIDDSMPHAGCLHISCFLGGIKSHAQHASFILKCRCRRRVRAAAEPRSSYSSMASSFPLAAMKCESASRSDDSSDAAADLSMTNGPDRHSLVSVLIRLIGFGASIAVIAHIEYDGIIWPVKYVLSNAIITMDRSGKPNNKRERH